MLGLLTCSIHSLKYLLTIKTYKLVQPLKNLTQKFINNDQMTVRDEFVKVTLSKLVNDIVFTYKYIELTNLFNIQI